MPTLYQIDAGIAAMRKKFLTKLEAYGTKDVEEYGMQGIISRIIDKKCRMETLVEKNVKAMGDEPLQDTAIDLMGYALIAYLYLRNEWSDGATPTAVEHKDKILIKTLQEGGGITPPKYEGDAGMDLVCSEDTTIVPFGKGTTNIPLGFAMKLPDGCWAEIRPRSSTATKMGIFVHQSVMDNLYVGPWFVVANSLGENPMSIKKGTRIAQCILHRLNPCDISVVDELPKTQRGEQGFGSSGLSQEMSEEMLP